MERLPCGQRFVLSAGQCRSKGLGVWAPSPGLPFAACDRASCCSLPSLVPFCERGNAAAEGASQALDPGKRGVSVGYHTRARVRVLEFQHSPAGGDCCPQLSR